MKNSESEKREGLNKMYEDGWQEVEGGEQINNKYINQSSVIVIWGPTLCIHICKMSVCQNLLVRH